MVFKCHPAMDAAMDSEYLLLYKQQVKMLLMR